MKPVIFPRWICDVTVPDRQERSVEDLIELAVDDDAVRRRAAILSGLSVSTRARSSHRFSPVITLGADQPAG